MSKITRDRTDAISSLLAYVGRPHDAITARCHTRSDSHTCRQSLHHCIRAGSAVRRVERWSMYSLNLTRWAAISLWL